MLTVDLRVLKEVTDHAQVDCGELKEAAINYGCGYHARSLRFSLYYFYLDLQKPR